VVFSGLTPTAYADPAAAATAGPPAIHSTTAHGLEEVIVTARRREGERPGHADLDIGRIW